MAGFFFNTPDGVRQFDSNGWPVIGHTARASVPSSALDFGSEFPFFTAKFIDITINGRSPMIAVRVPSTLHPVSGNPYKLGGIYSTRRNGTAFTFRVYVFSTNNDWAFDYFVIDRMQVAHDGMGLTFWDDSGQVVFSTATPFVTIPAAQASGRRHAVVGFASSTMSENVNDDFNNPTTQYEVTGYGFYEAGGMVFAATKVIDGGVVSGTSGPPYSGRDVAIAQNPLIIDVTDVGG